MVALVLAAAGAAAQMRQIGSVHNGVGRVSDNTVSLGGRLWRHVSAGAQPGGIQRGTAGPVDHRAGFLQAVEVRRWGLDTDGDGVPDELDWDNDGDGLADRSEVDGSAFEGHARTNPNNPDTDDDGMPDGAEAAGMYDPLDPAHRLEIVRIELDAGFPRIYWVGKGGGTVNTVRHTDHPAVTPYPHVLISAPFPGGVAPWYKVTNTIAWPAADALRLLQVLTER